MDREGLVIVGSGGHAVSLTESVSAMGLEISSYFSSNLVLPDLMGKPINAYSQLLDCTEPLQIVIAVGDNYTRERIFLELTARNPTFIFPSIIHPTAAVSATARIEAGAVVLQNAVVGPLSTISRGVIANSASVTEHQVWLGDFSSVGPGAVIGGGSKAGNRSAIAMGALVKHGIEMGSDSILGAGSYLNCDLPSNVVAWGRPARIMRTREPSDAYL